MKKYLMAVMALMCVVVFSGCSKDGENGGGGGESNSLNSTTWVSINTEVNGSSVFTSEATFVFSVATWNATLVRIETINGKEVDRYVEKVAGTYTYNHPNLKMTNEDGESLTTIVSGNKFTLEGGVFTKK